MSEALAPAASIVKFNCNQENKELAKSLGIKVGSMLGPLTTGWSCKAWPGLAGCHVLSIHGGLVGAAQSLARSA